MAFRRMRPKRIRRGFKPRRKRFGGFKQRRRGGGGRLRIGTRM